MKNNIVGTALVHEICPICCAETNYQIVINSVLTEHHAKKVNEFNNKAIGFSEPCKECQSKLNAGYVALIGIDPEKSSAKDGCVPLKNIYRTGRFVWIKKDISKKIFMQENVPFFLLENEVFDKLGIPFPPESEDKNG